MGPESKVVSTIGIDEGIDYLSREFIAKLDDNVNTIIEQYSSLSMNGTLSSENIDGLVAGIKAKVNELQNSFDQLAQTLKTNMIQSSETIAANRSNIENTLNQG